MGSHDSALSRYVGPLRPPPDRLSSYLPTSAEGLEEELGKQQSLLRLLHWQLEELRARGIAAGDPAREQELWEVQMVETQLKRKLKGAIAARAKVLSPPPFSARDVTDDVDLQEAAAAAAEEARGPPLELFEEKQLLAVQMELKDKIAAEKQVTRFPHGRSSFPLFRAPGHRPSTHSAASSGQPSWRGGWRRRRRRRARRRPPPGRRSSSRRAAATTSSSSRPSYHSQ